MGYKIKVGAMSARVGNEMIPVDIIASSEDAIRKWLEEHPDATTSVKDGSISYNKFNNEIKEKIDDIDVLNSRVDSFTRLEEGTTTSDAEIIDARIGTDGTNYNNLGTAIRTQINDLTLRIADDEDELERKSIKTRIDFDGNRTFSIGDRVLNYQELHDIHLEQPDFAFIAYGDRAYLLSYVQDDESAMRELRFQSTIGVTSGGVSNSKVSGIYVVSSDGVNIANVSVVDINNENVSYKATEINNTNKNSTVWYASTKAVNDYILGNYVDSVTLENKLKGVFQ